MPLTSIRRRMTLMTHRRTRSSDSNESNTLSDSSENDLGFGTPPVPVPVPVSRSSSRSAAASKRKAAQLSYLPHSRRDTLAAPPPLPSAPMPAIPPVPALPAGLARSNTVSHRPRFTRPRRAPAPPTPPMPLAMPTTAIPDVFSPATPVRSLTFLAASASASTPALVRPPAPPRAMPSWRAAFIAMADAYAPLGGVAPLLAQLHDPALSERQALAAIRRYVDGVHARRHEYGSDAGSEAEVSETSEVSGSESEGEDGPVYGIAL